MSPDTWALLAVFTLCVGCLCVGILIGIVMGRDDERARQHENRSFVGALHRHDVRPIR